MKGKFKQFKHHFQQYQQNKQSHLSSVYSTTLKSKRVAMEDIVYHRTLWGKYFKIFFETTEPFGIKLFP
jgi:hypothetical protein